jgi:hypothetical protein
MGDGTPNNAGNKDRIKRTDNYRRIKLLENVR